MPATKRSQPSMKPLMPTPSMAVKLIPNVMVMSLTGLKLQFWNPPLIQLKEYSWSNWKPAVMLSIRVRYMGNANITQRAVQLKLYFSSIPKPPRKDMTSCLTSSTWLSNAHRPLASTNAPSSSLDSIRKETRLDV